MSRQFVAVAAVLLAALPNLACALEDIVTLTPQQAAELGMIVRAEAAGPEAVAVELEFPTTGELKNHLRVKLRIEDGRKLNFATNFRDGKSVSL